MNPAQLDLVAGDVLDVLWRASWQAAVLAAMVLIVQRLLRGRLSARWRYNLWLLVLLRLIVPVTPQSSLSVFNLSNRLIPPARTSNTIPTKELQPLAVSRTSDARDVVDAPVRESAKTLSIRSQNVNARSLADAAKPQATPRATPRAPIPWRLILASVWITGTLVLLARIGYATLRLSRAVRRMTIVDSPHVTQLLRRCCDDLGIRRRVTILACDDLPAPALMGVIRPRLLLPRHVLAPEKFAADELRLILLHELAHLKRNDVLVNWLVSILHALHWFNPVLWLGFASLRADRELATDELVLSRTGDAAKSAYGQTIIKLLQSFSHTRRPAPLVGAVGILERAHTLRRRITMIAQFRHHAKRWTALAAVCMLALAGFGLTDAVRGDEKAPDKPSADARPAAVAVVAAPQAAPTTTPPPAAGTAEERLVEHLKAERKRDLKASAATQAAPARASAGAEGVPAATAAALRKLAENAPEVKFDAIPLADAIDFMRDVTGLNVFVNWRVLETAGVDRNAPVTVWLKNVPHELALRYILREAGGGGTVALEFAVIDGILNISTAEQLASDVKVRVYNISRLLHNLPSTQPAPAAAMPGEQGVVQENKADRVIQIITETVAPDSWRTAGGPVGSIREINGRLVVAQTEANHALIAKLLEEIDDDGTGGGAGGGAPAGPIDEAVSAKK